MLAGSETGLVRPMKSIDERLKRIEGALLAAYGKAHGRETDRQHQPRLRIMAALVLSEQLGSRDEMRMRDEFRMRDELGMRNAMRDLQSVSCRRCGGGVRRDWRQYYDSAEQVQRSHEGLAHQIIPWRCES